MVAAVRGSQRLLVVDSGLAAFGEKRSEADARPQVDHPQNANCLSSAQQIGLR